MAYYELIKNFDRIRDYMREFYLYGFKSRNEYTRKSARSYDDERRRVESWLGGYMRFRQTAEGKNVFLSIDSRVTRHNPLYAAWKTKSFTDGDITLHLILLDILNEPGTAKTIGEISGEVDEYLAEFREPKMFDESTIRKKLKEYASEGIITTEKRGKAMLYSRAGGSAEVPADVLDFFSETAPCGVIGSFLLDKGARHEGCFAFKHHYITATMDSGILCALFGAMAEKRAVTMTVIRRRQDSTTEERAVSLCVRVSVQNGRQYLMAYIPRTGMYASFRTDNILAVKAEEACAEFDRYRAELEEMKRHLWGISMPRTPDRRTEHIAFTVEYTEEEGHIHRRLEREKRCGTVERLGEHSSRFSAEVYDALEVLPWVRTFICRISRFECSDREVETRFREDLERMYRMYGTDGPEGGGDE